eukprot:6184642-Pleurochrysis_carterae.AAC.1
MSLVPPEPAFAGKCASSTAQNALLLALTGGCAPALSWPSGVHDIARSDIGQQAAYIRLKDKFMMNFK